ncbi:MAG TPA: TIGR00153 family protein [Kiritimatiellae bacterium]|nr:TIGR00153 family protein [Kiritimatiellia bacterium]
MTLISELFGQSPFGPLVEHARKVHECVEQIEPLTEAMIARDYDRVHRLQDEVSRLEYEADRIKFDIREHLPRQLFLPVDRADLERYLHYQDNIADFVEDYAVILFIRRTPIREGIVDLLRQLVRQVVSVSNQMLGVAEGMLDLVESSFSGAEARNVLERVAKLNQGEWMADRIQRRLSIKIYEMESELDPITILFYEKMLKALGAIANAAENTGDMLRAMIVKR